MSAILAVACGKKKQTATREMQAPKQEQTPEVTVEPVDVWKNDDAPYLPHGIPMYQEYEYPWNTMSQDWSGEDLEGFYYHEITQECKDDGGRFPVIAQVYTYIVCKQQGVDYETVFALIETESSCVWNAKGDKGTSIGLMQVSEKWHKERMQRLGCTDLTNPFQNIRVGVDILKELQERYKDIPEDIRSYYVLAAYNYGETGAKQHLFSKGIYKYTYNEAILKRAAELKREQEEGTQSE